MNGLDLIPSHPVGRGAMLEATRILETNFGIKYDNRKILDLFSLIKAERWSEERFRRTFLWFLKHKKFPAWTIADFFEYSIPVYPRAWYLQQQHESPDRDVLLEIDMYRLPDGTVVYKWKDGNDLPFEKIKYPFTNGEKDNVQ